MPEKHFPVMWLVYGNTSRQCFFFVFFTIYVTWNRYEYGYNVGKNIVSSNTKHTDFIQLFMYFLVYLLGIAKYFNNVWVLCFSSCLKWRKSGRDHLSWTTGRHCFCTLPLTKLTTEVDQCFFCILIKFY